MRLTLEIVEAVGEGWSGRREEVDAPDAFVIGRSLERTRFCVGEDRRCSRVHALIVVTQECCRIVDLRSTNGTFVNGRRIDEAMLADGDEIRVGDGRTVLRAHIEVGEEAPEAIEPAGVREGEVEGEVPEGSRPVVVDEGGVEEQERVLFRPVGSEGDEAAELRFIESGPAFRGGGAEAEGRRESRVARVRVRCAQCGVEAEANTLSPRAVTELQVFVCEQCAEQIRRSGMDIPGYRRSRDLDEGGMGRLWLAVRESDGEQVVIKTMRPECAVSRRGVQRFLREIRLMQRLQHPNIVRFIEAGDCGGILYIVMEYVEGTDAERLRRASPGGRLAPDLAMNITRQILSALQYAHSLPSPVYHRDIKPANILLVGAGVRYTAKLTDFGLARARGTHSITMRGEGLGTFPFMPPEQMISARSVGPEADIFGIGATLYYLVTGQFVYNIPPGADQAQAAAIVAEGLVVPVQRRGIGLPDRLVQVINRATAQRPDARYRTAQEMDQALAQALR